MNKLITSFWRWWYRRHPSPSKYTKEEALAIAREYELDAEVMMAMKQGCTPDEWDIYPQKPISLLKC